MPGNELHSLLNAARVSSLTPDDGGTSGGITGWAVSGGVDEGVLSLSPSESIVAGNDVAVAAVDAVDTTLAEDSCSDVAVVLGSGFTAGG